MALSEEQAENVRNQLLGQLDKVPEDQAASLREQIQGANPEELESFVKQMQQQAGGGECLFCGIVKGTVDSVRIYEDSDVLAVLDLYPATKGHVLVMPREHFRFIQEVPDHILNKVFLFVKALSPALVEVTQAKGLSVYIPQGAVAGQSIPHFFVNLIPRYEGDNLNLGWQKQKAEKTELEKIGEKLREKAKNKIVGTMEEEKKKVEEQVRKKEESEADQMMKHMKERLP